MHPHPQSSLGCSFHPFWPLHCAPSMGASSHCLHSNVHARLPCHHLCSTQDALLTPFSGSYLTEGHSSSTLTQTTLSSLLGSSTPFHARSQTSLPNLRIPSPSVSLPCPLLYPKSLPPARRALHLLRLNTHPWNIYKHPSGLSLCRNPACLQGFSSPAACTEAIWVCSGSCTRTVPLVPSRRCLAQPTYWLSVAFRLRTGEEESLNLKKDFMFYLVSVYIFKWHYQYIS